MIDDDERRRELAENAAALAVEVAGLNSRLEVSATRIAALTRQNAELTKQFNKHKGWIGATVAGLVLDLLLSVIIFLFYNQQADITDRLEISVREQCAFNSIILSSYRPESRPPGQLREEYEAAFAQMRRSYEILQCTDPIIPPGTYPPPPR